MSNFIQKYFERLITTLVLTTLLVSNATGDDKKMSDGYFREDNMSLESAILADDRGAIAQALAKGAKVNARGIHDITPLMLAVDRQKQQAVSELLAHGGNSVTPMKPCAIYRRSASKCFSLSILRIGFTPMHLLSRSPFLFPWRRAPPFWQR